MNGNVSDMTTQTGQPLGRTAATAVVATAAVLATLMVVIALLAAVGRSSMDDGRVTATTTPVSPGLQFRCENGVRSFTTVGTPEYASAVMRCTHPPR